MIRILIGLAALVALWILFFSGFNRSKRIASISLLGLLIVGGLWYEDYLKKPQTGVVSVGDIAACGMKTRFSYRTNYDFELCYENLTQAAIVKKLTLKVSALSCENQECEVVQSVERDHAVQIKPGTKAIFKDNIAFDAIQDTSVEPKWQIDVIDIYAN